MIWSTSPHRRRRRRKALQRIWWSCALLVHDCHLSCSFHFLPDTFSFRLGFFSHFAGTSSNRYWPTVCGHRVGDVDGGDVDSGHSDFIDITYSRSWPSSTSGSTQWETHTKGGTTESGRREREKRERGSKESANKFNWICEIRWAQTDESVDVGYTPSTKMEVGNPFRRKSFIHIYQRFSGELRREFRNSYMLAARVSEWVCDPHLIASIKRTNERGH